jgi:Zn-dependent protease
VTFHEAAHGFVADQFGDDTEQRAGRVTFNPFKHVDPFGTIILPAMLILLRSPFLFGYAKPVPVNFRRLDRPRRDMVWVALAGPGTNVLLAIVSSLLFFGVGFMPPSPAAWVAENLVPLDPDQRGSVRVQHAAPTPARRRQGGGWTVAGFAGASTGSA